MNNIVSVICFFCVTVLFNYVNTVPPSKNVEGYPGGLLPYCPGIESPPVISNESLKYLRIKVIGAKTKTPESNRKYSYYDISEMARHPTMDYSRKTILFISGYYDKTDNLAPRIMESNYRRLGYNVWLLDAYKFMSREYPTVVRAVPTIGKHVAEMIYNMTRQNVGFDVKSLEILGLSLGGQVISFVAKNFKELSGYKLPRLTALDPSGPCFRRSGPEHRLDRSDAEFVDVINVNIDGLGLAAQTGHVNFYVNGGEYQSSDIFWMPCEMLCSHVKAYLIWYTALRNPDSFIAMQCNSIQQAREKKCYDQKPIVTNLVGRKVDKTKHGIFYLPVTHNFPYYMGQKGLDKQYEPTAYELGKVNERDVLII